VITDGNYLLHTETPWTMVASVLDEVWYCELGDDERRRRLIARHVEFGKSPEAAAEWIERVDEPNARRIEATRSRATLTVHP
jgi:pantothenate kinase